MEELATSFFEDLTGTPKTGHSENKKETKTKDQVA
jgi:hypothetical protein